MAVKRSPVIWAERRGARKWPTPSWQRCKSKCQPLAIQRDDRGLRCGSLDATTATMPLQPCRFNPATATMARASDIAPPIVPVQRYRYQRKMVCHPCNALIGWAALGQPVFLPCAGFYISHRYHAGVKRRKRGGKNRGQGAAAGVRKAHLLRAPFAGDVVGKNIISVLTHVRIDAPCDMVIAIADILAFSAMIA